jgi:hypothetical protein
MMVLQSMIRTKRFGDILKKFTAIGSKPTPDSFPELVDCMIWLRFGIALAFGLYLGSITMTGGVYCIFGLNLITFIPIFYCQFLLVADMDAYKSSLYFAGVPNAFALFLLIWILCFTWQYSDEETKVATSAAVILPSLIPRIDPDDIVISPAILNSVEGEF